MPRRAPTDAFDAATALLAGRERSAAQLRAALERRGFPEAEIDDALARARQLGYLDDARVAAARARQELAKPTSRADVERRLVAQGLDPGEVARAVGAEAEASGHTDQAAAERLLARRHLSGPKAARALLAKGFEPALVARLTGVDVSGDLP